MDESGLELRNAACRGGITALAETPQRVLEDDPRDTVDDGALHRRLAVERVGRKVGLDAHGLRLDEARIRDDLDRRAHRLSESMDVRCHTGDDRDRLRRAIVRRVVSGRGQPELADAEPDEYRERQLQDDERSLLHAACPHAA